ncbi:hypothetical protein RCH12_002090 [Cryobacterium sp. MP_3.1]|uniref:hypothetical protein n=1 Tax=Cryobacterium sp. MP_3.1 TaxID=3071711 RepID=UPI002E082762|nr:hypothetical protein [Cryobacterium sp. MP_3.1]
MTTLNTARSFHQSRTVGLLGAFLAVALLAAGCSSPSAEETKAASAAPTATATPTPSAVSGEVEAPQSEAEAVEAATAAVQSYLDIRATIEIEHPADSSLIDTIAIGDAAANVRRIAGEIAEEGSVYSGTYAFGVTSAYANDLTLDGTVYPFGNAQLEGCFSSEGISVTNADGTPAEMISNRRGVVQASVFYVAAESKWFLTALGIAGTENVPC